MLTPRKVLVAKLRDIESSLRGILRGFGLKVAISKGKFETRIHELAAARPCSSGSPSRCCEHAQRRVPNMQACTSSCSKAVRAEEATDLVGLGAV